MTSPRYGSLSVRTECNHCGAPVPLDAPALELSCAQCTEQVSVPASLWGKMLHELDDQIDELAEGGGHTVNKVIGGQKLVYGIKREMPHCEKCNAPLAVADFPVGTSQNFACAQCGDPASTEPAPDWVVEVAPNARQLYRVDPDPELAGSGAIALEPAAAPRPIALSCPSCGGGLQITVDHPRLTPCRFCGADVYLPDPVWRKLHPVKVVTPFYVRFEGLTQRERAAAEEAQELRRAQMQAAEWTRAAQERAAEQAREAQQRADEKAREAQQRAAEAQQQAAEQAHQAEQRREEAERQIAATRPRAWTLSLLVGVGTAALMGVILLPKLGFYINIWAYIVGIIVLAALALILVGAAVFYGSRMLQLRCRVGFDYMFFVTWFWLPLAAIPFIGAAIAACVAVVLYGGKLPGAVISSSPTMDVGDLGRPTAFVFVVIALANLVLYLLAFI